MLVVTGKAAGSSWPSSQCGSVWWDSYILSIHLVSQCHLWLQAFLWAPHQLHCQGLLFFFFFHLCRNPGKAQVLLPQQDTEGLIYVWITAQVELLQYLVHSLPDWLLHGVLKFVQNSLYMLKDIQLNVSEISTPYLYKAVDYVGIWHYLNIKGFNYASLPTCPCPGLSQCLCGIWMDLMNVTCHCRGWLTTLTHCPWGTWTLLVSCCFFPLEQKLWFLSESVLSQLGISYDRGYEFQRNYFFFIHQFY